ncbi:MAG: hypothetical protein LBJ02_03265, partial [Bifidobacteriaceae bacterium]|nr:hypothetical protein [Bifidobacteriaceae bacterium]
NSTSEKPSSFSFLLRQIQLAIVLPSVRSVCRLFPSVEVPPLGIGDLFPAADASLIYLRLVVFPHDLSESTRP